MTARKVEVRAWAVICANGKIHRERMGICGPKCHTDHPHIFAPRDSFDRSVYECRDWKMFHDCAPHTVVKLTGSYTVPRGKAKARGQR